MRPILGLPPDRHRLRPPADDNRASFSPQQHIQEILSSFVGAHGVRPALHSNNAARAHLPFAPPDGGVRPYTGAWASWVALGEESDAAAFWQGVLSLTENLERGGDESTALSIYHYAAETLASQEALSALHRCFSAHRDALLGRGELSATRLDHLGRRFLRQATDPAMIGSFLIAGGANQLVRAFSSASLALRSGPAFWTNGLGAQALAGTLAFAVEVPIFVGASRGLNQIFSNTPNSGEEAPLGDAMFSAALFLGAVKFFGYFTQHVFRATPLLKRFAGAGRIAGSVSGIYLGQRLEEGFGLRPSRDEADRWVDVADTWLQLTVGGRIAASLIGPIGANLVFARGRRQGSPLTIFASRNNGDNGVRYRMAAEADEFEEADTSPNFRPPGPPLAQLFLRRGHLLSVRGRYDVEQIGRLSSHPDGFYSLLEKSKWRDPPRMEAALRRMQTMLDNSRPGGLRGNYLSWVVRLTVERLIQTGNAARFERLLNALYEGGPLSQFEADLNDVFPHAALEGGSRFGRLRSLTMFLGTDRAVSRQIRALPLSVGARTALQRFALREPEGFSVILNSFAEYLRLDPDQVPMIDRILNHALASPLGELRVHRLLQVVMTHPNLYPKIRELADFEMPLHSWEGRERYPYTLVETRNSWADAYLDDPTFTDYLNSFYLRLTHLLDPGQAQVRWEQTRSTMEKVVPAARPITESDVLRGLRALGDRYSLKVLDSLIYGRTALRIEDDGAFLEIARRLSPGENGEHLLGFFLPKGDIVEKDSFFIRQIRGVSTAPFHRVLFNRLATLIHEYEHHLLPPQNPRTRISALREEMIAHLRTIHWKAEHGDINEAVERSSQALGFAMALRDEVEKNNLSHPNPNL